MNFMSDLLASRESEGISNRSGNGEIPEQGLKVPNVVDWHITDLSFNIVQRDSLKSLEFQRFYNLSFC